MVSQTFHDFHRRFIAVGIFTLLLLIPFQFYFDVYGSLSVTVPAIISAILFLLLFFQERGSLKRTFGECEICGLVLLFAASMVLSTLFALDMGVSFKYGLKWLTYLSTFFIILWGIPALKNKEDFFVVLTLTACISTVIGIFFFLAGEKGLEEFLRSKAASLFFDSSTIKFGEINWFRGGGTGGTFFNRNWYAAFLGMVLPYCLLRALLVREGRPFWVSSAVILCSGLLISLSRGGWLGFIGFTLVSLFIFKKRYWKLFLGLVGGLILFLVVMAIISPSLRSSMLERSATVLIVDYKINRISIWSHSLDAMNDSPLHGIGVANNPIGSAHSNYLQILVEQGIIGLFLFVLLLSRIIRSLVVAVQRAETPEDYVLAAGLLGSWSWFCIQGLLSTTMFNDKVFITFACILGFTAFFVHRPGR